MEVHDPILHTGPVSEMTGLPEGTLRYYRSKGIGPKSTKIGRRIVYRRSDVERWIADQFEKAVGE